MGPSTGKTMSPDVWSAIGSCLAALAAITAVVVAYWQLSNLNKTLRMNALTVVLQLEAELNARKEKVDEVASRVRAECATEEPKQELVAIWESEMEGYLENWLNSADRLAFCISRGYLPERDWKTEYRNYFAGLIRDHTGHFGPASIYTNIIDLNDKWKRE